MAPEKERPDQEKKAGFFTEDTQQALIGGAAAGLVALLGVLVAGQVTGHEAQVLLQGVLPSIRFLSSGVMTAAATILALMLTLLSLSYNTEKSLDSSHYNRIRRIALIDTITLIASVILLLLISVPIESSDSVPSRWYVISYYLILLFAAGLGGALIATVLMLYAAVRDMIHIVKPGETSNRLVASSDDE